MKANALAKLLTPRGQGGISVIAGWGTDAAKRLDALFVSPQGRRLAQAPTGALLYGTLRQGGEVLDEVIVCRRPGRKEVFEINCHGGIVPLKRVISALAGSGFSIVADGESAPLATASDRSFLYPGTDDLICREALRRLQRAATHIAAKLLLDQARGALSSAVGVLLSESRADESAEGRVSRRALERIRRLRETAGLGINLCRPPRLVVAGPPNAGKSTLVNRLLAEERIIVHHTSGTTRDPVETQVSIRGYPFFLVDTAGIRETADRIERLSAERARLQIESGDLVLLIHDASRPYSRDDAAFLSALSGEPAGPLQARRPEPRLGPRRRHVSGSVRCGHAPGVRFLPVLNKADLGTALDRRELQGRLGRQAVIVSALHGDGIDRLEDAILAETFPRRWTPGMPAVFTERQERLLAAALGEPAKAGRYLAECLGRSPRRRPEKGET